MRAKAAGPHDWPPPVPPPASNDPSEAEPDRDDQDHREQDACVVIDVEASRYSQARQRSTAQRLLLDE